VPNPFVVVLDYGSGDARATADALETAGALVEVTSVRSTVMAADGFVVAGAGSFVETMGQLKSVRGPELIERRLAGGRPVFAIGSVMHVLFERGQDAGIEGLGEWPGELAAHVCNGWSAVEATVGSKLFEGLEGEEFLFQHDAAALDWTLDTIPPFTNATVTWADRGGRFIAAVENGPLVATQFHPQKSGEAGISLLRNWLATISRPH
jgi:glutamine amidotransferase